MDTIRLEPYFVSLLLTEIRLRLQYRDYNLEATDLGFQIVKPKNKAHIKVNGKKELNGILEKAGIDKEEFCGDIDEAPLWDSGLLRPEGTISSHKN